MPRIERFMVQAYAEAEDGELIAEEPVRLDTPEEAEALAGKLREKKAGVAAYKWAGDMHNSEIGKVTLICVDGALPERAEIELGLAEIPA